MSTPRYIGRILFEDNLEKDTYLRDLPVVEHLLEKPQLTLRKNVTFFVGENGTGKSTLLEAIAVAYGFNAEGGSVNFRFSTKDTHSQLYKCLTLSKTGRPRDGFFLRAESLYNVATKIDEMDSEPSFDPLVINSFGGVSLHKQSHGESFLSIVQNRFFGKGLYILDEPEAALSPMRLMTLIAEMGRLVADDSQFIIATHSPILMAYPDADILEFTDSGIKRTNYESTEHYQVTKSFFDDPRRMIKYILEDYN